MMMQQQQQQQFPPQMYQSPMLQPQRFQQQPPSTPLQQYRQPLAPTPPLQQPFIHHQQQQQQQQLHQQQFQQPEKAEKEEKGFRFFGKKRSKTQPSAAQPPDFGQSPQIQNCYLPLLPNGGTNDGYIPYNDHGVQEPGFHTTNNMSSTNNQQTYDSMPYFMPPRTPSPQPHVSAIFMTDTQTTTTAATVAVANASQPIAAAPVAEPGLQPSKSSKWKPFGKKKSKSLSTSIEVPMTAPTTTIATAQEPEPIVVSSFAPQVAQVVPASPFLAPMQHHHVELQDDIDVYLQQHEHLQAEQEQQQQQQQQNQGDWYVENTPEVDEEEFDDYNENPDLYFEAEEEDVDPYYIADTKGRARAFEGKVRKAQN